MSTTFSAGPQATGYLHQARYALYVLLASDLEETSLIIEGLDDIQVESESRFDLQQLKHHISDKASLSDTSSDLWKTLRVWSTHLAKQEWEPTETVLSLITTASAPDNSIASLLRHDSNRNEKQARNKLNEIADSSTNKDLQSAFAAFKNLGKELQVKLLKSVKIIDEAPSIVDMSALIKRKLRLSVSAERIDSLYSMVEGWWFDIVTRHLIEGSQQPIPRLSLEAKVVDFAGQLRRDNLPIHFATAHPDEEPDPETDERLFVHQLRVLSLGAGRISHAILDYYRAFEQRSRWTREQLLIDDELEHYEQKLVDEWDRYVQIWKDESDLSEDAACVDFGKRILRWMEVDANFPIRPQVQESYVMRGSFHMLADLMPPIGPKVHWHPRFAEKLEELTATNSKKH